MSRFSEGLKDDIAGPLSDGHCPDCGHRGFVLGPRGGEALNIECGNVECRSRFNVAVIAGWIAFAHRIASQAESGTVWPSEPRAPS